MKNLMYRGTKSKCNVLYVDDEDANLSVFQLTFQRHYNVFTAISGKKGLEILGETPMDLIITDQRMAGMSGIEFLEHVIELYPGPNRILLTGFSDFEVIKDAINRVNIFQFIQKPWEPETLKPTLDQAIESYHIRLENERLSKEILEKNIGLEGLNSKLEKEIELKNRTNKELQIAKEKAEESDRLKSAFLSSISHEIRTPLNAIIGFSTLITERVNDPRFKQFIRNIRHNNELLLKIIDDLIDMAVTEAKGYMITYSKFDLRKLVCDLYLLYEDKCQKGVTLQMDVGKDPMIIESDATRIRQVFINLLSNSLKFTERGEVTFGYKLDHKDGIRLFVSDSGIGIPHEARDIVFERFIKLDQFSQGTGLGLSIVKRLVELLGSSIELETELGKGSSFYFTLPHKVGIAGDSSEVITHLSQPGEEIADFLGYEPTILFVVDDLTNFQYIEELLESSCREIIHATNGKEAVALCRTKQNIDLVLMDLKMPVMDGIEATRRIKEMKPGLPVIVQTARVIQEIPDDRSPGWDAYISKPFDEQTLFQLVESTLKKAAKPKK